MKRFLFVVLLALVVLTVGQPATIQATEAEVSQFSGEVAEANFSTTRASGCIITDVWVFAVDGTRGPGKPEAVSWAYVLLTTYNVCTNESITSSDALTSLDADALQIDRHLNVATLSATVQLYDVVSDSTYPVDLNITWTGFGDSTVQRSREQVKGPTFLYNASRSITVRKAEASGTVIAPWGNATPEPAFQAQLLSDRNGQLILSR